MRRQIWLEVFLLTTLTNAGLAQTDFSASIVDLQKPEAPVLAKLSVFQDRRRLDMQPASGEGSIVAPLSARTPGKPDPGTEVRLGAPGRAVILNLTDHTSTLVIPDQKIYHTDPTYRLRPAEMYELYAVVRPANVDDACTEWMKKSSMEGESCKKVGEETVNGRSTVKYDLSCYGEICHLWIDRRLHVIVKRETKWNSTELRNIQEIPPDYSLFQPPADYVERGPGGVIQQHQPQ
jgi:hypothetical protein